MRDNNRLALKDLFFSEPADSPSTRLVKAGDGSKVVAHVLLTVQNFFS